MVSSPSLSTDVEALWGFGRECYPAAHFVLSLFWGFAARSQSNLRPKLLPVSHWLWLNSWPNKIVRWISMTGIMCYNFKRPENLSNSCSFDSLRLSSEQCILTAESTHLSFKFSILYSAVEVRNQKFPVLWVPRIGEWMYTCSSISAIYNLQPIWNLFLELNRELLEK